MTRFTSGLAGVTACLLLGGSAALLAQRNDDRQARPRLTLRATPAVGIAPARVVLTAELQGGANDYQDYYCASVEWDWGDGTRSEASSDCDPYEAGKSEIRRRFTTDRTFRRAGTHRVVIRLKQRGKEVAAATVNVTIQPGAPQ
jgi:hypothetical protein